MNWEFVNVMAMSTEEENLGFMWECPNFAEIDNHEVLILSPQGVEPEGNKFLNLNFTLKNYPINTPLICRGLIFLPMQRYRQV